MARLYMIRHGKPLATWGDHADPDPGLDDTGAGQAREASRALLALPPDRRPTRVMSSPLRRCRETALPFATAIVVGVDVEARFGEIPWIGLFSSFEIAPHGGEPALQLYTGVVGLFTSPS